MSAGSTLFAQAFLSQYGTLGECLMLHKFVPYFSSKSCIVGAHLNCLTEFRQCMHSWGKLIKIHLDLSSVYHKQSEWKFRAYFKDKLM